MALGQIDPPTFTEFKDWGHVQPILSTCDSCGAVVTDETRPTHERWHKGIARDITRAGRTVDPALYKS